MRFASAVVFGLLAAIATTFTQSETPDWREFRRQYPYHIQGIALSTPDKTGWRTLVVAEPPPSTTVQSLAAVDELLSNGTVKVYPLGMDGWVKDVVYRLPALPANRVTGLLDRLSLELFGTTYKSHAIPISSDGTEPPTLDLQVSAAQLQDWITNGKETFRPLGGGNAATLQQLLSERQTGVFYSTTPGLVAWIHPRQGDLSASRRYIRQFALDSDIIVGAVPGGTHVAVLARERQAPLTVLPPLRTETILQLAAVGDDELAQSYDRNDYGAGKLEDKRDWAPIYLSDELIDTEYGSLLNITDQLLKSWTNLGRTTYANFAYPTPRVWPFDKPLGDILQSQSLTYNWNTRGAGYSLTTGRGHIFALNRTGALPVSYMPEGMPLEVARDTGRYEDLAYSFFAADTSDPNLARVVQYAAIYQAFRLYKHHSPRNTRAADRPEMAALTAFVQHALVSFAQAEDEGLRSIAAANGFPRLSATALARLRQARDAVRGYQTLSGDESLATLARRTANPRADERAHFSTALEIVRERAVMAVRRVLDPVSGLFISPDGALAAYRRASRRDPQGWIRTPSYVVSTSRRPEAISGGHNLDARVTVFETSGTVPKGTVAIRSNARGERVITVNPVDAALVGRAVRSAARTDSAQVKASVESILRSATPKALPRNRALGLSPALGPAAVEADRGLVAAQLPAAAHRGGWALSGNQVAAEYKAAANSYSVFVDRNADYTFRVTLPNSEGMYTAASYDAAVDLVAHTMPGRSAAARPLTVFFSDVDRADAANFLRSLEVRASVAKTSRPTGFGRSDIRTFSRLKETLGRSYNFKSAKVTESVVEPAATGGERLRVTVEIPALESLKPPLLLRIKIFFRDRVSEPVRRSVEQIVTRILGRTPATRAAAPMSGAEIAAAIRHDLRKLHPHLNVEVGIDLGVGDYFVADVLTGVPRHGVS